MYTLVYGYFTDELDLLDAVTNIQDKGVTISDVRTPFPVHGLDKALKLPRSRLPKVAFAAGFAGGLFAMLFQIWVFTKAWPIIFGGKPFLSILSFIPVTFELTILFAAFAMGFAFLISSGLGPGKIPLILDEEVTNDRFQVILDTKNNEISETELAEVLSGVGALDVKQFNTEE